jgi:putative ATP-dependent endonuclease of OLD family
VDRTTSGANETMRCMKVSRVVIDNLLGFRHLDMRMHPNIQLIAGPNNAGKSSFVRLLEVFFSDPAGAEIVAMQPRFDWYAEAGPRTLSTVTVWFNDLDESDLESFASSYRKRDRSIWISLRCGRGGEVSFTASNSNHEQARSAYMQIIDRFHFVKIPSVRVGGAGDAGQLASLERLIDTIEAILIRRGGGKRTAVQKKFADEMTKVEKVVKEVLDESASSIADELPFQGGAVSFELPDQRHALRGMLQAAIIESGDGARVPVADRGTGFQSALVLGMLRYVASRESQGASDVVFAVEEPEAFLHPQTQRAMTQVLKRIAADAQMVVTTHSAVVVDTFDVSCVARLPLSPEGTHLTWEPPVLDDAREGRLGRYCNATNSELVFASAAIFVEGEGDLLVIQRLLGHLCEDTGGYYARGMTVIEAGGIGRIGRLVELAEHFGVRAFVLTDRDGLRAADGRKLLTALAARTKSPDPGEKAQIHLAADRASPTYGEALSNQAKVNDLLAPFDAYVMCSDLEGLLLDAYGVETALKVLGPGGEGVLAQQYLDDLSSDADVYMKLRSRLGSKGWDADGRPSNKLEPHVPALFVENVLRDVAPVPKEMQGLLDWLEVVLDSTVKAAI